MKKAPVTGLQLQDYSCGGDSRGVRHTRLDTANPVISKLLPPDDEDEDGFTEVALVVVVLIVVELRFDNGIERVVGFGM